MRRILLVDAAVVVLVIVIAVLAFLAGRGAGQTRSASTMQVSGTLTLNDPQTALNRCIGTNGFDDIGPSTRVLLFEDGRLVAFTSLGRAKANGSLRTCTWSWAIENVPKGHGIYSVEVSHRGWNTFTQNQLTSGRAALKLQRSPG
ncbi:MAG: hypothetical protein M3P23_01375 [Actinomycetota bacterium]|nr:hypothetical protein [Actinomycetota bacterium]